MEEDEDEDVVGREERSGWVAEVGREVFVEWC